MADLENILNNEGEPISDEVLMKYLQGNLSEEEAHAVEKQITDSPFVNDALEGLEKFKNKKQIHQVINELNQHLQQQTHKSKSRRAKRKLEGIDGILVAVIIVLMLCMLGYTVLHMYHHQKQATEQKSK
jgi:hypothetical protein